jgi:hypothetical protein
MRRTMLAVLCSIVGILEAQTFRGNIVGRVMDPTGAVIAGVEVRATNTSTGVAVSSQTNESGDYSIPYLIPGTYTVEASAAGFKKYVRENIQVRLEDTVDVRIPMELGSSVERVEVKADTPLLSTAESSLGQVMDTRRIAELPTYGGNPLTLSALTPGIVNATDLRVKKIASNQGSSQINTDGTGMWNNEILLDGVSNIQAQGVQAYAASMPPTTAVQEFRVQTAPFDASVGHTFGALISVTVKSGTNQLHGEAHEWFRNRALDAPNLFQNRTGTKLPVYQDNRFGASGGGPVYIPGVYNGKNKTFWFHSYEANIFGVPQTFVTAVPNASARAGDLSYLLKIGPNYQIYDPSTATRQANGTTTRLPFANNIIPSNRISPIAQKIMSLWPMPNQPGSADGTNTWVNADTSRQRSWSHFSRVDHAFSEKNRVFVRFNKDRWQSQANRTYSNSTNGVLVVRRNTGAVIDDVWVVSPRFLVNTRYGLTRQWYGESRLSEGFDLTSVGFSPALVALTRDPKANTVPRVSVAPYGGIGDINEGDGIHNVLTHSFNTNITYSRGSHSIRSGVDFRVYLENHDRHPADASPTLSYTSAYTSASSASAAPTLGGAWATFLLGIPEGSLSRTASYASSEKYVGAYVQDDWRVSSRLTINIGLRYEFESPITERYNRAVTSFAFDQANPLQAAAQANYARSTIAELPASQFRVLGGLQFAGVNGNSRHFWKGDNGNFIPRFGLAYTLNAKTVLRAGYGWFFNTIGVAMQPAVQTGFSQTTPIKASPDNGLTFDVPLSNPFPNGLIPVVGSAGGLLTGIGQSLSFFAPEREHPYVQRWTANIQRQLPGQFLLETAYVGSRATRLGVSRNINADSLQYLSKSLVRDNDTITRLGALSPNPFAGLDPIYSASISRLGLLRSYPQFGTLTMADLPVGYSWYHSLQVRAEKRFSHGFTFNAAYTWSKSMEAMVFQNAADPRPYEQISNFDRAHRIAVSWIWDLPFGRTRRYGRGFSGPVNFLAGGWTLNSVVQRQSGPPLEWGDIWPLFTGDSTKVGLAKDVRTVDRWINTDAGFNKNSAQQLASNVRYSPFRFSNLRADGQSRWDFTLSKDFPIRERLKAQFRAEVDNAWNHPNLLLPNMTPTAATFGAITGQDVPRVWQLNLNISF